MAPVGYAKDPLLMMEAFSAIVRGKMVPMLETFPAGLERFRAVQFRVCFTSCFLGLMLCC